MDNIHANWLDTPEVAMALELSDPNQPYSCSAWGNEFDDSEPLIVNGGSPYYDWWGMFETTYVPAHAFIDHNMKLIYKTNSMSYGTAMSKIEQMLENCGECYIGDELIPDNSLNSESYQEFCCETFGGSYHNSGILDWDEYYCENSESTWVRLCGNPDGDNDGFLTEDDNCPNDYNPDQADIDNDNVGDVCDDCNNMSGDPNDDMVVNILDVVSVVQIILNGSSSGTECELSDADMTGDGVVNILDVIQIINIILGPERSFEIIDGMVNVSYSINDNDLILKFTSNVSISGLELSFISDYLLNIENDDIDLYTATNLYADVQRYLIFSMENIPFSDNSLEIVIKDGSLLDIEDIYMIISSTSGTEVPVILDAAEIKTFHLSNLQPNPFNPVTQIHYDLYKAGNISLSIYNILGQEVLNLYNGYMVSGSHKLVWDANGLTSGIYYVSMFMNGHTETMKAVLIK